MNKTGDSNNFLNKLSQFKPDANAASRALAVYAAAIATADDLSIRKSSRLAAEFGAQQAAIYELMLQSYLFLGFPRMLTAAECFREEFPDYIVESVREESGNAFDKWKIRGTLLCQKVYGENFGKLKARIEEFTPEIYEWMILEGYGKVLSRPALDIKIRELGVVAMLLVDRRPKQLYSHLRGALNVGVEQKLLEDVIGDVALISGSDKEIAFSYLQKLKNEI